MSFVVTLALLIGLLTLVPVLAHLLRRGHAKEVPFPPTRFIPTQEHVAKRRSRFEDRLLLTLRASIIAVLALIGATPLLRCERAVLERRNGASVAVVIVLDDSASMRNRLSSGETRFAKAKRVTGELIDQLREGDSIGLVLAGTPARMLLLPTSSPAILSQQLLATHESDRSTDLASAIALAESTLDRQPHADKRIIVLSDLAGELPKLSERISRLLPELTEPTHDCAVISAIRNRGQITVDLACSLGYPNGERKLQLLRATQPKQPLAEKSVVVHPGREVSVFENAVGGEPLLVHLAGTDKNAQDDSTPVVDGSDGPSIATYSDPVAGRGTTGGPPLLEQALRALNANLTIRSLPTVPEDERDLDGVHLLLLDDPPLLSTESRNAIVAFAEDGGTAVAFFGPSAAAAQLGSLLLPFAERRATWEDTAPAGLDPSSVTALGIAAQSLIDIAPKGRFCFDESHDPKVVVRGRWSDQKPFWIERPLGRGLVMTLGLPASIAQSDLALRTGFIALLDQILGTSARLGVARVTTVGRVWRFPDVAPLHIEGPSGAASQSDFLPAERNERHFVPTEVGRYRVAFGAKSEERIALYPAEEVLEPSRPWPVIATAKPDRAAGRLDLSRSLILALLPLLALELAIRSAIVREYLRKGWLWLRQMRLTLGAKKPP